MLTRGLAWPSSFMGVPLNSNVKVRHAFLMVLACHGSCQVDVPLL